MKCLRGLAAKARQKSCVLVAVIRSKVVEGGKKSPSLPDRVQFSHKQEGEEGGRGGGRGKRRTGKRIPLTAQTSSFIYLYNIFFFISFSDLTAKKWKKKTKKKKREEKDSRLDH